MSNSFIFLLVFIFYFSIYLYLFRSFWHSLLGASAIIPGFILLVLLKRFVRSSSAHELLAAIVRALFYAPAVLLVAHVPFYFFPTAYALIFIATIPLSELPPVELFLLFCPSLIVFFFSLVYSTFAFIAKEREKKKMDM